MWRMTTMGLLWVISSATLAREPADIATIVRNVMTDTYGNAYDARNACWTYRWKNDQGEEATYCMRPGKPEVVDGTLYLRTFNATDTGDAHYAYAHVEPGLMGAFRIRLHDKGAWTYQAFEPAMDYGSAGDCGCAQARFVKLGAQGPYGWMFTSGGIWSGVVVENLSIVTDLHGTMKDIAGLPMRAEDNQDTSYRFSIAPGATQGMYPLHAVKTVKGKPSTTFDVPFDPATSRYMLPSAH
ncbi:MAG: hypothetical protein GAK28_02374 [Luteibacter sp.]|nr:MAG: hypothetical protein GAK28_02374 [Luteibacter sp.]